MEKSSVDRQQDLKDRITRLESRLSELNIDELNHKISPTPNHHGIGLLWWGDYDARQRIGVTWESRSTFQTSGNKKGIFKPLVDAPLVIFLEVCNNHLDKFVAKLLEQHQKNNNDCDAAVSEIKSAIKKVDELL